MSDSVGIRVYDDEDSVDVTEKVTCYEHGKTFECECGQGIGVHLERREIKCASCNKICVDRLYDEREPVERDEGQITFDDIEAGGDGSSGGGGQSTLGDW